MNRMKKKRVWKNVVIPESIEAGWESQRTRDKGLRTETGDEHCL